MKEKSSQPSNTPQNVHYDQGWNARVENEPFNPYATVDWKDGWLDCDGAPEEERKEV